VINGRSDALQPDIDSQEVVRQARSLLQKGLSRRDILKQLSAEMGIKRNTLYRMLIESV